jgi:hypothetical protein
MHHRIRVAIAQLELRHQPTAPLAVFGQATGGHRQMQVGDAAAGLGLDVAQVGWTAACGSAMAGSIGWNPHAAQGAAPPRRQSGRRPRISRFTLRRTSPWTPAPPPSACASRNCARCCMARGRARAAGAVGRPAPVGIPARPLAGARVVLGLHRVDGHAGGHGRPRGAVCRQPLLGAGRSRTGRHRHRAGEDPHRRSTAHIDWLAEQVPAGRTVAVDGQVLGLAAAQMLQGRAGQAAGVHAAHRRRPAGRRLARPPGAARAAGLRTPRAARRQPRAAKLAAVREAMARHGATHHFVSTVDDIAWITNLRGSDVTTTRCSWPTC